MAIKLPNGDILRNLYEQVQKNKQDIQHHYDIDRVLTDYGIHVVGAVASADELPNPASY
jgi:succinate dehydrogenase/fumarate reductase flavoprotein subunit